MKLQKLGRLLPALLIAAAVGMSLLALFFLLSAPSPDAALRDGRQRFLAGLGWEIDAESEERKEVLIPDCAAGVMADYNALQLRQGFDLSRFEGKRVIQYSYRVLNYPGYDQAVYATLYVSGHRVVGGDIHSAALNGFMHGLTRSAAT